MPDPVCLPLAEAAHALGTTPDALRKRVRRGQVEAVRDNLGRLKVWVPAPAGADRLSSPVRNVQAGRGQAQAGQAADLASLVQAVVQPLRDHIDTLQAGLCQAHQEAREARQEAAQARDRADALIDRLGGLERTLGAVEADRDRLRRKIAAAEGRHQTEVQILKIEVEQARRPWWRRWRR